MQNDIIDSQIIAENVCFLDCTIDNSNLIKDSIKSLKQCEDLQYHAKTNKKNRRSIGNNSVILNKTLEPSQKKVSNKLSAWGLPYEIVNKYEDKGIQEMFAWQVDCLGNSKVLLDGCNLVYSAPTSAGKTLVAEILTVKTVLERQKKVIIILPFISIVREKMFYLQDILSTSGIRVEGFTGSQSPAGGIQSVHIAICTIEKANSLINRLLDDGSISSLGAVIVDELHLLGDPHRGYILELLLTKVKYVSSKLGLNIQIVGMSATLPNLRVLAQWLDAELYVTQFRPIPLDEYCLVSNKMYDKSGNQVKVLEPKNLSASDADNILSICLETIQEGCSLLIFCMTKNRCENLAQTIASSFFKLGSVGTGFGLMLREQLKTDSIKEVLEQLISCPVGLDNLLKNIISFGVAYHHAGLTFDERDIIEGGFKSGAIRVLVATSTLSSGVNLPARKVIIRSPMFQRQAINILSYKQMVGRAGRMGKDTKGESIIICTESEKKVGFNLMMGKLDSVTSCIDSQDKFMRATLEIIASEVANTKEELELYCSCTLLFNQDESIDGSQKNLLEKTLAELSNFELIRTQDNNNELKYTATLLGKACLSSSMAPNDGLSLFCELQRARQCVVLENDLHLIYLVTPYSVSNQWGDIDWLHLLTMWESLTKSMKRVGELVGVQESFIVRCVRGTNHLQNSNSKLNIHKRFYTALALQDLVNETPLSDVSLKFRCARGFLQSLQQSAATFAGMVTAFCHQLGWKNMEILMSQFQDRLHFGIHTELIELMRLPSLNGLRARSLFDSGFETIASLASADPVLVETALIKAVPFQSEKKRDNDDVDDIRKRNKIRNVWITGCCGLTTREAAEKVIAESRIYLEREMGVSNVKWKTDDSILPKEELNINNEDAIVKLVNENSPNCSHNKDTQDKIDENEIDSGTNQKEVSEDKAEIISNQNHEITQIVETVENYSTPKPAHKIHFEEINKIDFVEIQKEDSIISEYKVENSNTLNTEANIPNELPSQDNIVWDSLNLSEIRLSNLTKIRESKYLSPEISFSDSENKLNDSAIEIVNKSVSKIKDLSLFSSEGENSSLFEDSLPIDSLCSKVLDQSNSAKDTDYYSPIADSSSILNAFHSNIFISDDEEDIKLVYEEDKLSSNESDKRSDNLKRSINTEEDMPIHKKPRINEILENHESKSFPDKQGIICDKSQTISLIHDKKEYKCFNLKLSDISKNSQIIAKSKNISFTIFNPIKTTPKEVIGLKLLKPGHNDKENHRPAGVVLYLGLDYFIFIDVTNDADPSRNIDQLQNIFIEQNHDFIVYSLRRNYLFLKRNCDIDLPASCFDVGVAEWLLDCDEKEPSLELMINKYFNHDTTFYPKDSIEDVCIKTLAIWNVFEKQKTQLQKYYEDPFKILRLEVHISKILSLCEYHGITVDKKLASELLIDTKNSKEMIQKKTYSICGYHFNFNSSRSVAKALGMYRGKKVSTKKSVLTSHNSPLASCIIYWRKLNSILTKTLYPLTEKAVIRGSNDKIYPSYTTYTCSGRISMHEPNLQNVPRTFTVPYNYLSIDQISSNDVIEFNCRNIFRPTPDYVFVSADYCQLEMRILTHYCEDPVLTKIMRSDLDVFKSIAASWNCCSEDDVDDDIRQRAKQLCYGIIYGMGNKTLAKTLDVDEMEAAIFMDTFHKTYPKIKTFTQSVVDGCKEKGYIETLMKRRRYLPDVNCRDSFRRSTAERQAVNTTIQGSAADIAKSAMIGIDNRIATFKDKPRLILQMHDELIYEVPKDIKQEFVVIIRDVMEHAVVLNVPLPVKVKCGLSWGDMVEIKKNQS